MASGCEKMVWRIGYRHSSRRFGQRLARLHGIRVREDGLENWVSALIEEIWPKIGEATWHPGARRWFGELGIGTHRGDLAKDWRGYMASGCEKMVWRIGYRHSSRRFGQRLARLHGIRV